MLEWFTGTIAGKFISTFFISMLPVVELRLGLPYGIALGLDYPLALTAAVLGNMLPVPFIYLFARKVLEIGSSCNVTFFRKFCCWCMEKGERGGEKLKAKAGRGLFVALLLFVGIPLPGTGAWTGTLAASILKMDFKSSILAVMLGVLLAGIIMGTGSTVLFSLIRLF